MREVFTLPERSRLGPSGSRITKRNWTTHRYFEAFLRPPTILEAQVEESDLAPDDGQTPKNDKSLLDDVWAGDSRHRLSFTVEPHGKE